MYYSDDSMAAVFILMYAIIYLFAIAVSILTYVLRSLGTYTIAKRRGINNPILAWFPITNLWILGSIADQYDEAVKGVKKKSRVWLVAMSIITMLVAVAVSVVSIIFTVVMVSMLDSYSYNAENSMIIMIIVIVIVCLVMFAVAIAQSVMMYVAYYKLFKSCKPDSAVLFLVLSIFISIALPILIFVCRKDDLGMPQVSQTEGYTY